MRQDDFNLFLDFFFLMSFSLHLQQLCVPQWDQDSMEVLGLKGSLPLLVLFFAFTRVAFCLYSCCFLPLLVLFFSFTRVAFCLYSCCFLPLLVLFFAFTRVVFCLYSCCFLLVLVLFFAFTGVVFCLYS